MKRFIISAIVVLSVISMVGIVLVTFSAGGKSIELGILLSILHLIVICSALAYFAGFKKVFIPSILLFITVFFVVRFYFPDLPSFLIHLVE